MTSSNARTIRSASISDIHLGHHNTSTEHIVRNLRAAFPDTEETGKLDIIYFGGDLFDRPMSMKDPAVTEIQLWMFSFLTICARRQIKVRVLEGTASHDWGQNRTFQAVWEIMNSTVDFKYIDKLSIEHIEDLGIHVLYVPDDWRPEPDDTWKDVQQELQAHGLSQVDYAVIHGSFDHQLPEFVKAPKHLGERYAAIVRHYIFLGHVHLRSKRGSILANGSFDRLSHGEEDPKGHWRIRVGGDTPDELVFVENATAKVYRTLSCAGLPLEEALAKISAVEALPDDSHVRIEAASDDPIMVSLDVLRQRYPQHHWTTKAVGEKSVQANLLEDHRGDFQEIHITKDNLEELLMQRVATLTSDPSIAALCRQRLRETIA